MNPDGFERVTRSNSHGVDLNTNFPTWQQVKRQTSRSLPPLLQLGGSRENLVRDKEPEVEALVDWVLDNPFVVSVNLQDGAMETLVPWDDNVTNIWQKSDLFRWPESSNHYHL